MNKKQKGILMQIDDSMLLKFFTYIFGIVTSALGVIYFYIWKGDRVRIKVLEEKMGHVVTKPEIETIVSKVEDRFQSEHKGLSEKIESVHEEIKRNRQEIREDISYIRAILTPGYNGVDRRRK